MRQALYRKYRSKSFSEVKGQEHITRTLQQAIASGKISHAYLFTGPRGVGKTSVARILAHEVNNIPYKYDGAHLDIIEIDAASNRGVDDARNLREKVYLTPTQAKYKVYIIDEVHMLTREAFNALLKTLEEPPAHTIFVLATTEAHKLPETIISRTQRFSFKPIGQKEIALQLKSIAQKEKISITDDALELLAEHGQGSFRDAISLLDQLSAGRTKITEQTVRERLGLPTPDSIENLVDCVEVGQAARVISCLEEMEEQGVNSALIAKELSSKLRHKLLQGGAQGWVSVLLKDLLSVPTSSRPREYLEIALLEAAGANQEISINQIVDKKVVPKSKKEAHPNVKTQPQLVQKSASIVAEKNSPAFDIQDWPKIVEYAKEHNTALYTALRLATPTASQSTLSLNFKFPLHQKKLNQTRQKDLIAKIIEDLSGTKMEIECLVNKDLFKSEKVSPKNQSKTPIKNISNIFGNVEMLS